MVAVDYDGVVVEERPTAVVFSDCPALHVQNFSTKQKAPTTGLV